jgi:5-methyltetrahydrofolate--homocysteine methyltransferase
MRDFLAATRERTIVYDGGMGATLEQFELSLERDYRLPGRCHEALVLNRPDVIEGVHSSMIDAGAEVLETDTFQASRLKLAEWGLEQHTHEINLKAAQIARKAAGELRFVAGAIGPTGFLPASDDPTLGQVTFAELVEVFADQATGLLEGGVDLVIIETAQDILELKAAIFGVRQASSALGRAVPIQCSVSLLPQGGKMLLGTDISAVLATLEALRVDAIGLNCSTGPEDMRDASSGSSARSPSTASRTPVSRSRDRMVRRSSPSSRSRWPTCSASSSTAMASRSSGAAAARPPPTSPPWPSGSRAVGRRSARRDAPRT